MERVSVSTNNAPSAIGPYSQAVRCGNFLFISGQIPLDSSGKLVEGPIVKQTEQVMKNLLAILGSQDLNFSHVVKTTVFLKDMNDFAEFNETYARFVKAPFPARATIEVARLPKDVRVEIEAIALCDR